MTDSEMTGVIFNTQKFSIHDGSGIRTNVFLKGCPLRCRWCSNPESHLFAPEHAFNPNRCIGADKCGRCLETCQKGAIKLRGGLLRWEASLCDSCGACAARCPGGAQIMYGQKMSVSEIVRKVQEDDVFYFRSGGGLTLSGGEPMAQPEFSLALLREARRACIHVMMESCGHYPASWLDGACRLLDGLIFDVKSLDSAKHERFTGHGNGLILKNLRHVLDNFPELPLTVRTPVIPGFNDDIDEIMAIRAMLPDRPGVKYEILTYHRLGMPKYAYLGREWKMGEASADEGFMKMARERIAEYSAAK